jgi:hypothetical protein
VDTCEKEIEGRAPGTTANLSKDIQPSLRDLSAFCIISPAMNRWAINVRPGRDGN